MTPKKLLALPVLLFVFVTVHAQHKLALAANDTLLCTYVKDNSFQLTRDKSSAGGLTAGFIFKYEALVLQKDSVKKLLLTKSLFTGADTTLLNTKLAAITDTITAAYKDFWLSQLKITPAPDSVTIVLLKNDDASGIVLSALRSKDAGDAPTINVYKNGKLLATTQDVTKKTSKDGFSNTYKAIVTGKVTGESVNDNIRLATYVDTVYTTVTQYLAQNIGVTSRLAPNFDSLTYNDSLRAHITLHKRVAVYKIDKDAKIFKPTPDSITLERGTLYIKDGFIDNIEFDVSEDDRARFRIAPTQNFAQKINLRNTLFAGYMLNKPYINVKGGGLEIAVSDDTTIRAATRPWNIMLLEPEFRTNIDNNTTPRYVIFPGDLVSFTPPYRAPNPIFTAREAVYSFVKKDTLWDKPIAVQEKSLYAFINLDVYSDLIGLFDENKPNGLLQTELKVQFRGFRRPFGQKYASRARVTPLDKGEFFVRFSKLDAKNKFLGVLHDTTAAGNDIKYVHAFNLMQYKSLYMGIRANLLDIEYRGGSAALVGEAAFFRTPLRDTLVSTAGGTTTKTPIEFGINSRLIAPGINFKLNVASFLDLEFLFRYIWLKQQGDKNIQMSRSEYSEVYPSNFFNEAAYAETWLKNYKATVTINLDDDKTKRIILTVEKTREIKQEGNNFWMAQVGYSADLNKFLTFKNDKDKK